MCSGPSYAELVTEDEVLARTKVFIFNSNNNNNKRTIFNAQ